jgi:Protein of unknown function (DUF2934)
MTDTEKKTTKPRKPQTIAAKLAQSKATVPNKSAARSKVTQMKASHEEIARLAHRFWTERGGQHGHDTEDWLRAEREILGKAS